MYKIKANQFPNETRQHRMGGFPNVYQLKYGSNAMLYFGFENIEEYEQALELNDGTPVLIEFSKRYNPADFDKLTNPEPMVKETNLRYAYHNPFMTRVTLDNCTAMLRNMIDSCTSEAGKVDFKTINRFVNDMSHVLCDKPNFDLYCSLTKPEWQLFLNTAMSNGKGLYLAILVK